MRRFLLGYLENFLRKFVKYESFIITVLAFHNLQTTDMLLKSSDHFHIIIIYFLSLYVFSHQIYVIF